MHTTQSDKNHKINKPMTHIKSFSYQNICIFAKSNQCDKYHFNLYCYEQKSNFHNGSGRIPWLGTSPKQLHIFRAYKICNSCKQSAW